MAVAIRLLMPAAAERNKLIAHIDKRHGHTASLVLVAAPKIERKNAALETQRLLDITDLQSNVVEADQTRFCICHCQSAFSPGYCDFLSKPAK
jgi:hypothetical protein